MPEDYHDIQLPRVARQITFVRGTDEPSDAVDEPPEATRHHIGRLTPFTGMLDTRLGGDHWRFLRLSYLLSQPPVVTERIERVREVHHHQPTRQTAERRGTDTRRGTGSPTTRTTRSHPRWMTRLVTEQFPQTTQFVSRHAEERGSGTTERERQGRKTPTVFDRRERTEWPALDPSKGSSGPWRAPTPPGRWVYRRPRLNATETGTAGTGGEGRAPDQSRRDRGGSTLERAGQGTETRPLGSDRHDERAGFEAGLSTRRLPPRIHRPVQSPVEGVSTDTPRPPGRGSLRIVQRDTARAVRTDESRTTRSAEPRTTATRSVDSGTGREARGGSDGPTRPTTHLERQVARRRSRLRRAVEHPRRVGLEPTVTRRTDRGEVTRAGGSPGSRVDDQRSFVGVSRPGGTPPQQSDAEPGRRSTPFASADEPSERRVRDALREVSPEASGLPRLEPLVSPPRGTVERVEINRGPPTVMRETRLRVATEGTGGHENERGAFGPLDEPRLRQQSADTSTRESPRSVAPAPPLAGDTAVSDRPRLVHRRDRRPSDGERPEPVETNERSSPGRTTTQQRPATATDSTPEPNSSPEQHISALESIANRHMAADPTIDRLVDHLFVRLERKLRIERERRGR